MNLYPEYSAKEFGTETPAVQLLSPGLVRVLALPDATTVRCLYTATNGDVYAVCGQSVYWLQMYGNVLNPVAIGVIAAGTTPVYIEDNGTEALLVDGTSVGYTILLATHVMSGITAESNSGTNGFVYYGANRVGYSDTFLFGNVPGTPGWWASSSGGLLFDPLSFGTKSGRSDPIQAVVPLKRYILLLGTQASEYWYNAGGANFPYALLPGPYIEHGSVGIYSVIKTGSVCLFISKDQWGVAMVYSVEDFGCKRVSNPAIEQEWSKYPDLAQAVGFAYQWGGHTFAHWRFPQSDKTWVFDLSTAQWHERSTLDASGKEHQWRGNCATYGFGQVLVGDYSNGYIYALSTNSTTDNGTPILRLRGFPHKLNELKRMVDWCFIADVQVGEPFTPSVPNTQLWYDAAGGPSGDGQLTADPAGGANLYLDPYIVVPTATATPEMALRWSDTRGRSYGPKLLRDMGPPGQYNRLVQWNQLGIARDRVYELSWTSSQLSSLQGAYVRRTPAVT